MSKNPKTTLMSTKKRLVPKSGTNGFFHPFSPGFFPGIHPGRMAGPASSIPLVPQPLVLGLESGPKKTRKSGENHGKSDEHLGTSLVYGKQELPEIMVSHPINLGENLWIFAGVRRYCCIGHRSVYQFGMSQKVGGWSLTPLYPEVVDAYCIYIYIYYCM